MLKPGVMHKTKRKRVHLIIVWREEKEASTPTLKALSQSSHGLASIPIYYCMILLPSLFMYTCVKIAFCRPLQPAGKKFFSRA